MGIIDTWCNVFTPEGLDRWWRQPPEVMEVVKWWGLESRLAGHSPKEFVMEMDASGIDAVLVPSAKMCSFQTNQLIWDISEEEVARLIEAAPGRVYGLVGINPREGMRGVRRIEEWVRNGGFVGAHLHTYGYGLPLNDRRYYPFYGKCAELGVPVLMQVGHSAERMPSAMGRPILVDDIALDFPELKIVGAHTGWPWVEEMIAIAWKHRNVYIGTSAHNPRYWDPSLVRFANGRGRGKVLFGTDYPFMNFAEAVGAIDKVELRPDAKQLLLGNAARSVFTLIK